MVHHSNNYGGVDTPFCLLSSPTHINLNKVNKKITRCHPRGCSAVAKFPACMHSTRVRNPRSALHTLGLAIDPCRIQSTTLIPATGGNFLIKRCREQQNPELLIGVTTPPVFNRIHPRLATRYAELHSRTASAVMPNSQRNLQTAPKIAARPQRDCRAAHAPQPPHSHRAAISNRRGCGAGRFYAPRHQERTAGRLSLDGRCAAAHRH